jgi:hypothetical protein
MKTIWCLAIILVGLLMGLSFAHLLESPAKMQYAADMYVAIQRTLYVQWGPPHIGAFLEPAAILLTCILPFLLRRQANSFWAVIFAAIALFMAFPLVYFWLVDPTNQALRGEVSDAIPYDWAYLRSRWELGHRMRFGLHLAAFIALVSPLLWDKTTEEPPEEQED